jgi:hypothetical protein
VSVRTPWGAILELCAGNIAATLPQLKGVGLLNLCEVASHQITRIARSTSHVVRFHGGGYVQFAYNDAGVLIELSGWRISAQVAADGTLMIGPYREDLIAGRGAA